MKKIIKKAMASFMAAVTLVMGMSSISASAISETVYFHKVPGAPGSATVLSTVWNYTTTINTTTVTVSNFTSTEPNNRIFVYISVEGVTKAGGYIYPPGGSVSATGLSIGKPAYASASVDNTSGTTYATVSITG